jgi:hypothetical protein
MGRPQPEVTVTVQRLLVGTVLLLVTDTTLIMDTFHFHNDSKPFDGRLVSQHTSPNPQSKHVLTLICSDQF